MSNGHQHVWNHPVTLAVLLSRDFMGADQYRSRFALPVESYAYSTERKQVRTGQGSPLKRFLENPIRTSPNPQHPATRILPDWIYRAVERYVVRAGRTNSGYTLELVGKGEPSITWHLKRLVGRRAMRYNPVKLLGARGQRERYERAMDALGRGAPLAFSDEAEKLTIDHWIRRIHFILRMTAFRSSGEMDAWIARHPRPGAGPVESIDREGTPPVLSDPPAGEPAREWFKTMGWYALPDRLVHEMDPEAQSFAFTELGWWKRLKAYVARGPDNLMVNFLNWPLEAAALQNERCPPGTVTTEFDCDLRLEVYG